MNPAHMQNLFFLRLHLIAKIKSIAQAILKRPAHIEINVEAFLRALGASYIINFVKIGANDGLKNDPLAESIVQFKWHGIMVEPFEPNFKRLKESFGNRENIILENAGISDKSGFFDFYYISDIREDEPGWYDQVGSFDKETFLKNIEVEEKLFLRIASKKIPCISFDELISKHALSNIDLIHIDTEGYDWKILKSIDLRKYFPKVIIFEIEWLTVFDIREAKKYLSNNGYQLYYSQGDCIAVKLI